MSQPSLDLDYDDGPDPTFTVGELAEAIKQVLRRGFDDGVWVRGEIQGFQPRANGHVYFNLTERGDAGQSTIPVALWAGTLARLRGLLAKNRMRLENGLAVRIHARLDFYGPSGRLSLVMDGLDPTYTLGRLAAERDQLLRRLVAEGLLDANKRHRLAVAPLRIGVVTSVGSAAWADLTHELEASGIAFHLLAAHTTVQGDGAVDGIVAALAALGRRHPEVIVIVRGGSSRTDLATFDDERIARAIAACAVPVWTGLGHEIDRAVADDVAHAAHKTPTACAVALVARVRDAHLRAETAWSGVVVQTGADLDAHERRLDDRARQVSRRTEGAVAVADERVRARAGRVVAAARRRLDAEHARTGLRAHRAATSAPAALRAAHAHLDLSAARVGALDPAVAMARGWSITRGPDGRVVRSVDQVADGAVLRTVVADGAIVSEVTAREHGSSANAQDTHTR